MRRCWAAFSHSLCWPQRMAHCRSTWWRLASTRTRLLSLENTHHGKVLPLAYLEQAWAFTRQHQLALHIDGARIFNAVVAQQTTLAAIARYCDTLTICLSKGLGTPAGSLLCGDTALIERARRWRKMTGGGMRQAGILAAAGLYAFGHNVARLQEDHDNAAWLGEQLQALGVSVIDQQTNMLFVAVPEDQVSALGDWMKAHGVLISVGTRTRLVTHLDVDRAALTQVVAHWKAFLQQR